MTITADHAIAPPAGASSRRILFASLIGTTVEYYDFYIYATAAALVLGPLFFPSESASAQLMAAYASFGLAFIARPLGASIFGHFGDRVGRKSTLVAALLIMGLSTLAIAFLPTYASVGWIAPLLLCILRFGQGLGLGGEWGGATLLALENAPPGFKARFGMVPQLGAPLGFIAANGMFLLLGALMTRAQFQEWGWRLPFFASIFLVVLGLWVRLKLTETPAFAKAMAEAPPAKVPLGEVLKNHPKEMIGGLFASIIPFALFYLSTGFSLGYGTTTLGYPQQTMLGVQLGAIVFLAIGTIVAGAAADRFGQIRVLIAGSIGAIVAGLLLAPMLGSGSLGLIFVFFAYSLFTMGITFGPIGAWLPNLFPARVRYTGASVSFNIGGILGGGLAPIVAAALASYGGLPWVGAYLAGAATLSLIALVSLRKA